MKKENASSRIESLFVQLYLTCAAGTFQTKSLTLTVSTVYQGAFFRMRSLVHGSMTAQIRYKFTKEQDKKETFVQENCLL